MSTFNIVISVDSPVEIPRTRWLSEEVVKARNFGMNQDYITKLQNTLLDIIPLVQAQNQEAAIALYDAEYDSIISLRNAAYEEMKQKCLDSSIPPEKSVPS